MMITVFWFAFVLQGIVPTSSHRTNNATRIGNRFVDERAPYQLSLNYPNMGHYCGGSIITKDAALTVVYCLEHKAVTNIFFRCGIVDLKEDSRLGAYGKESIFHEKYDGISNIVALVLVQGKFPIDGVYVAPIQIAADPPRAGTTVTLSAWTTYQQLGEDDTTFLQALNIDIIGHGMCAAKFGEYQPSVVNPGTLCAGPDYDGNAYCFGDSGSPLVNNLGQLVGAVSWHEKKCLNSGLPGIFCDFFYYKTWISKRLKKRGRSLNGNTSSVLVLSSLPFILAPTTCLLS